jgi:hypothetical protein
MYFNKDNPAYFLKAIAKNKNHLNLQINECSSKEIIWEQSSPDASFAVTYFLNDLLPNRTYLIYGDDILLKKSKSDAKGNLIFNQDINTKKLRIVLEN